MDLFSFTKIRYFLFVISITFLAGCGSENDQETQSNITGDNDMTGTSTQVVIKTNLGDITVQLDNEKAPVTTANFLAYVNDEFYDGTIFHRVIPRFMIQGGGFNADMVEQTTGDPIKNEANNGLPNVRGSIAMARTPDPDSATAQFFINLTDNDFLNFRSETPDGWGYAVFGQTIAGIEVVDEIAQQPTGTVQGHGDVPLTPVVIESIRVVTTSDDSN